MYSLHLKGSLTLECAWILPLFILGMTILFSILDLYRIQAILTVSLSQSSRELGMYAYAGDGQESPVGSITDAVCAAYASSDVRRRLQGERLTGIVGGKSGITFLESKYNKGIITLKASYFYKSPIQLIPAKPVRITAAASAQAWTGYSGNKYGGKTENIQEDMVYITEYESVYHDSSECTYLELYVSRVLEKNIENRRNEYGDKYKPCEKCAGNGTEIVYITNKGSKYHEDRECSGLTRHVKLVKASEAGDLKPCSRCVGK